MPPPKLEIKKSFGIDFGTNGCVVAAPLCTVFGNDQVPPQHNEFISILLNENNLRSTPARILLEGNDRLIGIASQRNQAISSFKKYLGFLSPEFKDMTYNVDYNGGSEFTLEQITAMYLRKLIQSCKQAGDLPTDFKVPSFDIF
jgi:molecular chaperone DnaK (HSP70)